MIKITYRYEYKDNTQRQEIIDEHKDKFLIEEQNITEGNFLIFADTQPPREVINVIVKEEDLNEIKQQQILIKKAIDDLILGGAL